MKTSKLILITFVGLIFSIMTVTLDLHEKEHLLPIEELPTAVKSCLHKYFPNKDVAYSKMKDEFIKTTYEMGKNNYYGNEFYTDGVVTDFDY